METPKTKKTAAEPACIAYAKEVFSVEAAAIAELANRLDGNFSEAIEKILACKGRIVVCGIGKSGIIGKKISGTLTSTGTPSFFMHPAEAFHGDLGMIKREDILFDISSSSATPDLNETANQVFESVGGVISLIGSGAVFVSFVVVVLGRAFGTVFFCRFNLFLSFALLLF